MAVDHFIKDPQAVLDYQFDWSDWLGLDTIASHTVEAESEDITVDSTSDTDTVVTAWLSGGQVGEDYRVTCHIVTVGGREDDRTMVIEVREK